MKKFAAAFAVIIFIAFCTMPVFGKGISISSENGERISILNDIEIESPANGNVIAVLGNVSVGSSVNGQVVAVFGDIIVDSDVAGQVVTVFGNTIIKKDAKISGGVIAIGSLKKEEGAVISGQEVRILGDSMNLDIGAIFYLRLALIILFAAAVLIVGLLILFISKDHYFLLASNIEKDMGKKAILGILTFLAANILLVLLIVTLIAPLLYIVVLVLSAITASIYSGRLILKTFSSGNSVFVEFITGLFSITLIKLLLLFLIPEQDLLMGLALTGLFNFIIFSLGLGIHMNGRYVNSK